MALSPRWLDSGLEKMFNNTKYEIAYWVNYGDDNTYGWFSVEQIQEWLNNKDIQLHTLGGTKER